MSITKLHKQSVFLRIQVGTNSQTKAENEGRDWFFSRLTLTPCVRVRLAREALTLLLLYSKPILRTNPDLFAV